MNHAVRTLWLASAVAALFLVTLVPVIGQGGAPQLDRMRGLPGVDQFQKMQTALQGPPAVVSGGVNVTWAPDAKSFTYTTAGKSYKYDITTMRAEVTGDAPAAGAAGGRGAGGRAGGAPPAGGRQGGVGGGRGGPSLAT